MSIGQEIDDISLSFNRLKIDKDITDILNSIFIGKDLILVDDLLKHNFFKEIEQEKPKKLIIKDTGMLHLFFQIKIGLDKKRQSKPINQSDDYDHQVIKSSLKIGALTTSVDIISELREKEKLNKNNLQKPSMVLESISEDETTTSSQESNSILSARTKSIDINKINRSSGKQNPLSGSYIQLETSDDKTSNEKEEALKNLKILLDNGFIDNEEYSARKEQLDDGAGDETTTEYESSPYLNDNLTKNDEIRVFTDKDEMIETFGDDEDQDELKKNQNVNSDDDQNEEEEIFVEELSDGGEEEDDIEVESF